jgi:hypothetical protein
MQTPLRNIDNHAEVSDEELEIKWEDRTKEN